MNFVCSSCGCLNSVQLRDCGLCGRHRRLDGEVIGKKLDDGKRRYSLVPPSVMAEFVDVLTFGADKYGDHNWKTIPRLQDRYYDALQRHVDAFRNGNSNDDESGKHHLAHAMCCLAFMMQDDIDQGDQ